MKIKKILIVPTELIVENKPEQYSAAYFIDGLKELKRKIWKAPSVYNGELQFYAAIPGLLGEDNTFLFGRYYPHFYSKIMPDDCAYPSCHGTPRPTELSEKEVKRLMPGVDAIIVSTLAGRRGEFAIREARAHDVPVAMIDFKDHFDIFGASPPAVRQGLFRGFIRGKHFDLFFKKDLPLGYANEYTIPVAPVPVRPESYDFRVLPKDIDIFYSGAMRLKGVGDRFEVTELVRSSFPKSVILEKSRGGSFLSTRDYLDYLGRARIALSPSGFVWDSFRHCEVGLAPETALFAPKPYMEVVGPFLQDDVNAILYETEFSDGKYHLTGERELIAKIRDYLAHPAELERIAKAWARDVREGHTVTARARYLIGCMERVF